MRKLLVVLLVGLGAGAWFLALTPRSADAQGKPPAGCKTNCTFTGNTTVVTLDAGAVVLGSGTTTVPQVRAAGSDFFIAAPTANDIIFESADGTERGRFKAAGQITGSIITLSGATGAGTKTLSTGSGTVAVFSGARCVCTDTTAVAAVKCSVSATTLTITGTSSDVIAYLCF